VPNTKRPARAKRTVVVELTRAEAELMRSSAEYCSWNCRCRRCKHIDSATDKLERALRGGKR
jgi:hypothetical protein